MTPRSSAAPPAVPREVMSSRKRKMQGRPFLPALLLLPPPEAPQQERQGACASDETGMLKKFRQEMIPHPTASKGGVLWHNPDFPSYIVKKTSPTSTGSNEVNILKRLPECPFIVAVKAFSQPEQSYVVYGRETPNESPKEWRRPVGPFKPTYILLDRCKTDMYEHLRNCQSKPTTHDKWGVQAPHPSRRPPP